MKSKYSRPETGVPRRPRSAAVQWLLPALFGIFCYHVLISWLYPPIQRLFSSRVQISQEKTLSTGEFSWAKVSVAVPILFLHLCELFTIGSDGTLHQIGTDINLINFNCA